MNHITVDVILVDDADLIRECLEELLLRTKSVRLVAYAKTGKEALEQFRRVRADIAVIDLIMPEMDGLTIAQAALTNVRKLKVVIFSGFYFESHVQRAKDMGVSAFVLKDRMEDLIEVIIQVANGAGFLNTASKIEASKLPCVVTKYQPSSPKAAFTRRETEVLRLWTSGFEVKEIASILHITERTVTTHRAAIIRKAGTRSLADLTRLALCLQLIDL